MTLSDNMNQKPGRKQLIGLLSFHTGSQHPHSQLPALVYVGFGTIISQILLLREFLVGFYGNELSIGIVIACWLVWIGIGSVLGNVVVTHGRNTSRLFHVLLAMTPFITTAQILLVKYIRAVHPADIGVFLSLVDLLRFSILILSSGCLIWGMLFTLGAKTAGSERREFWSGVNAAYIVESLGSVAGGLLFSFLFASWLSTLQMLLLLLFLAVSVVVWISYSVSRRFMVFFSACQLVLFGVLLKPMQSLEHTVTANQWSFINRQLTFIRSLDTKYQNLSLLALERQYTVYADGRPAYTLPNVYDAERFTHSIMIHRIGAQHVLVIGAGFNGVLREILKYPVQDVTYIEIDPALLPFVDPVMSVQDRQALHDARVHIVVEDGRDFLRRTAETYDVVIMNVGEPSTASLNRFYTEECFQQISQHITRDGLFAFSFPSSDEYIADELKDLDASMYHTMKQIFRTTLIIPGTHAVFIGRTDALPFVSQPDSLARRYAAAGISAEYFTQYTFGELMQQDQIRSITKTLDSAQHVRINTDNEPVTYYYDLLLWNKFLQGSNVFFSTITRTRLYIASAIVAGLLCLFLLFTRSRRDTQSRTALAIFMAVGGMTGMALNLLLLLNFQETFGSIYEMVGTMIATPMLGMALGAWGISRILNKRSPGMFLLPMLLLLTCLVLLMPSLLSMLLKAHFIPATLFLALSCGLIIGIIFGIVNRHYLAISHHPGSVYAFDILGSSFGALTTCSLLLPVAGIHGVVFVLVLLLLPAFLAAVILHL